MHRLVENRLEGKNLRKFMALMATAVVVISLTGCASGNAADAISAGTKVVCNQLNAGSSAAQISGSTDLKKVPDLKFPTPLTANKVETKVLVAGNGTLFTGNQLSEIEYQIYNAGTGALIQSSKFDGTDTATEYFKKKGVPDFCDALVGVREGSRVAILYPPKFAHNNEGIPSLGVAKDAGIIFAFDLKKLYLSRAVGDAQLPKSGMPSVVLTPEGVPGFSIPKTAAPTELQVSTLIKGRGAVVKKGQLATVNYSGIVWSTRVKFDSSWDNGTPAQLQLTKGQTIPGMINALAGQTVGSQVLMVIPPSLAYGSQSTSLIPANATLIFVVDILGVK
jgi:FKBP-type peptidyl-prolyl cis-trans isomerase